MYIIKTEQHFDSAHFLAGYQGKCGNIHGHRWRVVVEVCRDDLTENGQNRGMIVDFSQLKNDLKKEADHLDHCLIIERHTLRERTLDALIDEGFRIVIVDFRPTAENFAKYFYDYMSCKGYNVRRATVYETEHNCATYHGHGEVSYEL